MNIETWLDGERWVGASAPVACGHAIRVRFLQFSISLENMYVHSMIIYQNKINFQVDKLLTSFGLQEKRTKEPVGTPRKLQGCTTVFPSAFTFFSRNTNILAFHKNGSHFS